MNAVGVIAIGYVYHAWKDSIENTICSWDPDCLRHSAASLFIHLVRKHVGLFYNWLHIFLLLASDIM